MEKGYLALVLHGHLPFVRHPEHDRFLEEDWLYEAITETYIPLINVFDGLVDDGVDFRLTMSLTPTLVSMLADPLLQQRYPATSGGSSSSPIRRSSARSASPLQCARPECTGTCLSTPGSCSRRSTDGDLVAAFRKFQDLGKLEIITCGATHGFLPLMENAEGGPGADHGRRGPLYESISARQPRGIWLPECGYYEGLDEYPAARPASATSSPNRTACSTPRPGPSTACTPRSFARSGVAAFGRDMESSKQVWSAIEGYPGDYLYREFYRDIGLRSRLRVHQAVYAPRRHPREPRHQVLPDHAAVGPQGALRSARGRSSGRPLHAGNFLFNREKQVEWLSGVFDGPAADHRGPVRRGAVRPLVVRGAGLDQFPCPKGRASTRRPSRLITPTEYLAENPEMPGRRSRPCRAGATRGMPRSGSTARTTGSTPTCTRRRSAWSSWPRPHPRPDGLLLARAQPGGARAAAGAGLATGPSS